MCEIQLTVHHLHRYVSYFWFSFALLSHDTIWDPVLADEAQRRGEDITGFLGKNHLLLHQELLMEVLHVCAYSVHTAEKEYERILGFRELTSSSFSAEECSLFLQFLHQNKKDWVAISRAMKRTRSEVMVHYYKWKGKEVKRNKGDNVYVNLKKGWKSDYCYICDDGGELIICDGCHRAVHPLCLTPPLKSVPKGDWFCPRCTVSPVKPVRDGPRQRCSAGNYARTPTSVCRTRPDSTTPVEGVPESPSAKRVLLDGFSECSLPASNRWDELSSTPTTSKVSKVLDVETPGSSSVGSVYSPGGD